MNKLWLSSIVPLFILSTNLHAANPAPYNFNVYSIDNIGTSSNPYGSDFQGISGSGEDAYFSGFSGNAVGPSYPYSFYAGGNYTQTSGSVNNGGVEAQGNINLNSTTINGNIHGGANLQGGNGQVNGNVNITGTNTSTLTISGSTSTGQAYVPSLDLKSITSYFQNASSYWGSLAPTATYTNVYGQLQVSNLVSGRNIVDLSLSDLSGAYGIKLTGPSDAFVIFNITDSTPTSTALKDVTFSLNSGILSTDVLFNLTNATQLTLSGGDYLSVLAPKASITFSSGLVTGNLIAQNLYGAGQVNEGTFTGFANDQNNFNIAAPEPSTYFTLASCLGLVIFWKKKEIKVRT